jgi:hypothetical protein
MKFYFIILFIFPFPLLLKSEEIKIIEDKKLLKKNLEIKSNYYKENKDFDDNLRSRS